MAEKMPDRIEISRYNEVAELNTYDAEGNLLSRQMLTLIRKDDDLINCLLDKKWLLSTFAREHAAEMYGILMAVSMKEGNKNEIGKRASAVLDTIEQEAADEQDCT